VIYKFISCISIFFLLFTNGCTTSSKIKKSKETRSPPVAVKSVIAKPVTDESITVKKTLKISAHSLIVDHIIVNDFKCPHDSDRKLYKKILINGIQLNLNCIVDYLGGFFIDGIDTAIAQSDSDGGTTWKIESTISIRNNTVIVTTSTKRSHDGFLDSKEDLYTWDASQKLFILTEGEFREYEED